ncbi:MAG: hypothetical protein JSS94_02755 [Bacteroidetes bacterium]|nr:hypothetical protein [Bacteroidota bacterium]
MFFLKKNLLFFILFSFSTFWAQEEVHFPLKKYKVSVLSDSLNENSGLSFFQNNLYTLNDGGNPSEIYQIDPSTGKIKQTIKIPLQNKDWEALDFSDQDLFIGDFGNNTGTRKDLKIYKLPIHNQTIAVDSVQTYSYYYPEQKDFSPKNLNTDYDAEAMIFLNGKLHIFTKEWASKSCTHYLIDSTITILQPAVKLEQYHTGFVVTDAAYFRSKLYLLGYTKTTGAYLMIFRESEAGMFFKDPIKKLYLGSTFGLSQLEGLAVNENGIYLSGEAFHSPLGIKKQRLFFIP